MQNCIYRFLNKDNEIIYIGKAKDLKNRLNSHNHLPKECYDERIKIEYVSFDTMDEADIVERYLISKVKPKYNTDFKSKEIAMTIDVFESFQWIDFNTKNNIIIDFETRKDLAKIDLDIQKKYIEIEAINKKMETISYMKNGILDSNGKGHPCVVHIDKNTRYHIYHNDELYNSSIEEINRNSEGLDEYADLYEKWFDEYDKERTLLKDINYLKSKKIDLLLKINNKSCNEDIKSLYMEYDSVDDEFITSNGIKSIEDKYKRKLSEDIINYGYYDYNKFIQNIDNEFDYNKYLHKKSWLRLIENIESKDIQKRYADNVIKNIENYLENLFGYFKLDTIIKDAKCMFNSARILPTAYLIKKPINS